MTKRNEWAAITWLGHRYGILKEAISAHVMEMYFASVSTLLPQIEGVISEKSELSGFAKQTKLIESINKLLDQDGEFSLDDAVRVFYTDFVLDSFILGQAIKSPLSRHAIAHVADTKFHGWLTISENTYEEDTESLLLVIADIRAYIEN
ncbi:hypothetical protein QFZ77_003972 [Paenibacillus sp. V4I3]|uniref:hypothetical protein n=1 Tax=unclassified Paenibacillus TaxID=185978 RepID=UPI00278056B0|nr:MULTISPECIES: hypothetical protein [unclassified Paenibacillus]MDQ0875313.1 hypothetical protein [Paenibacillus sp. V4I3]MDQ0888956.1 hypothetical protein [Paenibacillus sp. V4I9]